MQDSSFVHESWSSNRVPDLIQNIVGVPIEFPIESPFKTSQTKFGHRKQIASFLTRDRAQTNKKQTKGNY
jgi:hypothetical protein